MSPSSARARLARAAALACALALACGGCGLGAGRAPTAVQLTVTREFGQATVRSFTAPHLSGQETVMSLLMRNASVTTRYGGGFVQSIDGLAGGQQGGGQVDWFYYVNGVEAPKGAASTNVHPGDHIWWDRHDWSQTDDVPAVVGSFPEPFLNGLDGKRLPVRVECTSVSGFACRTVISRLRARGVPAAIAAVSPSGEPNTLRVVVAPWPALKGDPTVRAIERGPAASGVYARFESDARTLMLLDPQGHPAGALAAGTGLIAATRSDEDAPVWVVTGTDEAGTERAARAFDEAALEHRFAIAVTDGGEALALPRGTA
jgi:Domain of unknown function (DUF4430)